MSRHWNFNVLYQMEKALFESSETDIICLSRHTCFDLNEVREIQLHGFSDTSKHI